MNEELLNEWLRAKDELSRWKHEEARLRAMVVEEHFNVVFPGTNTLEDDSSTLRVVLPTTYKVSKDVPQEWRGSKVFRHKVELDKREYEKLDVNARSQLDEYVISSHGTPRVEYKMKETQ